MEVTVGHKMLHIVIIMLASFLFILSVLSYWRDKRRKLLFISSAFLLFALRELTLFSEVVLSYKLDIVIPLINAPITHFLGLLILILFFIGIFSK